MDRRIAKLVALAGALSATVVWWCVTTQSTVVVPQDSDEQLVPAVDDRNEVSGEGGLHHRSAVPPGSGLPVLRVVVRDDRREVLGGINVLLLDATNRSVVAAEGTTDIAKGAVSFSLKVGRYDLCINTQGARALGFAPSVESISLGQLPTASIERTLQRRNASLRVVVKDDLGALVPGIEVSVDGFRSVVRTDLRGVVYIDRLLPGKRSVAARRTEVTPVSVAVPESLAKVVELKGGQDALCFFDLVRMGALDTRLDCANAKGVRHEQVAVELVYSTGDYSYPIKRRGVTLGKTFRFEHLPPGSYEVRYLLAAESLLCVRKDRMTVAVKSGSVATYVARALPATGVVAGRVSCDGVPVVGVPMSVLGRAADGRWDRWQLKAGHTKKGGRFEFRGLPETSYRLFIQSHLVPGTQEFAYFGSFESPYLELQASVSGLEIELVRGALLKGRVVEGEKPVAQGEVVLNRARFDAEVAVDLRGDRPGLFEFGHLRPGSYVLTFRRGEAIVASRKIVIDGAAKPLVEIKWDVKKKD